VEEKRYPSVDLKEKRRNMKYGPAQSNEIVYELHFLDIFEVEG